MTHPPVDPVELTAALVRCPSVTPSEAGALQLLDKVLSDAGFACQRVDRGGVPNLFARWGPKEAARSFGFNGHTDVVPPGDESAWSFPAFGAAIDSGRLWGRGAVDMKSGVAAFAAAAADFAGASPSGECAVVLLITGDEEGPATDGTAALLDWMAQSGETMDACLVGEPTCRERMGDMMKIGRRGALTARIDVAGEQGHAAYPHKARNPVPAMARLIDRLSSHRLDEGNASFEPSSVAAVAIETGNPVSNVIPGGCSATLNVRFNNEHDSGSVIGWIEREAEAVAAQCGVEARVSAQVSGESFLTEPGELSRLVEEAVEAQTGLRPEASTSGGTSDARFIRSVCPVVEFGLVGATMHQVDENVPVEQIAQLKSVYGRILETYFGARP